uniref:Uncharacterized protein n=1 Tax=Setaria italica TaxID=4555 RepID=K4A3Z7_SETIT
MNSSMAEKKNYSGILNPAVDKAVVAGRVPGQKCRFGWGLEGDRIASEHRHD